MADPWKRREVIGSCTLYLGDCLEILPTLEKVDAVLADPPYELSDVGPGKSHFGMSLSKFDGAAYKAIVAGVDYSRLFDGIEAVCRPANGFVFCSNRQISKLMAEAERRFDNATLLVWHKTNAAPFANGVWRGDIEYIVHFRSKGATFNGGATEKTKVLPHPIVQDTAHPTVKPLPIISRLVSNCSDRGQTIADPFMGSGSTGVACVKAGRSFIGIEIDEGYFDIACDRIRKAYDQPDMFVAAPEPKPEQLSILDAAE